MTVKAWQCGSCGHIWLKSGVVPTHCAKCRSRRWNDGSKAEPVVRVSRTVRAVSDASVGVLPKVKEVVVPPVPIMRTELGGHIRGSRCCLYRVQGRNYCTTCKVYF